MLNRYTFSPLGSVETCLTLVFYSRCRTAAGRPNVLRTIQIKRRRTADATIGRTRTDVGDVPKKYVLDNVTKSKYRHGATCYGDSYAYVPVRGLARANFVSPVYANVLPEFPITEQYRNRRSFVRIFTSFYWATNKHGGSTFSTFELTNRESYTYD